MTTRARYRSALQITGWWGGLFALVVAARLVFVSIYAESIPFWDQWDAEGAYLLKLWAEGSLTVGSLIEPHNEHRIVFTRLISLALFELNQGQWDNLVSAIANVGLYGVLAVVMFELFRRNTTSLLGQFVVFCASLSIGLLPFGWENTLVGFQNQFYLMILIALVTIALAGARDLSTLRCVAIVALAGLGTLTMASGLLTAVAAAALLIVRTWLGEVRVRPASLTVGVLMALSVLAYIAVPVIVPHQALKAPDVVSWARAFCVVAGWPLGWGYWGAILIWSPTALFGLRLLASRRAERGELFAGGVALWVLLQCAAIAYSRGAELANVPSRYTDVIAVGILANIWFGLRAIGSHEPVGSRIMDGVVLIACLIGIGLGLFQRTPGDLAAAELRSAYSHAQTERVRTFVRENDHSALKAPGLQIPYPDPGRLAELLSDSTVRAILPGSVREPVRLEVTSATPSPATAFRSGFDTCDISRQCSLDTGEWPIARLIARLPYIAVPSIVGGLATDSSVGVVVVREDSREYKAFIDSGPQFILVSESGSKLHVFDRSEHAWLAVGPPLEFGPLSFFARKLQRAVRHAWGRPDPSLPSPGVYTYAPFLDQGSIPMALEPGQTIAGTLPSPVNGLVIGLAIYIGNFGNLADGDLLVEICSSTACVEASASVSTSLDNDFLNAQLVEPLRVVPEETLRVKLSTRGASHRLAIWLYPSRPGAMEIENSSATQDRTIRLRLTYLH